MKKTIILVLVILFSTAPALASALDKTQQEKDFEVKKRIFGIRYPWEMVEPYPHVRGPKTDVILDGVKSPARQPGFPQIRPISPFNKPLTPEGVIPFA